MKVNAIHVGLMFLVTLATCDELSLLLASSKAKCLAEQDVFDMSETAFETLLFVVTSMPANVPFFAVDIVYSHPKGCNLRDKDRGSSLIGLLNEMVAEAPAYSGFNVFIGPDIESDCEFVGDWVSQSNASLKPIDRLFQIEYNCQYNFQKGHVSVYAPRDYLPSMTVVIHMMTIIARLELWLRIQGWRRLVIVCESSSTTTDCSNLAPALRFALNMQYPEMKKITIIASASFQPGGNAVHLLHLCGEDDIDGEYVLFLYCANTL